MDCRFQELDDYFDVHYITGMWGVQSGQQGVQMILQRPPTVPPASWNMNAVTLANGHRTNNNCESWNMEVITKTIPHVSVLERHESEASSSPLVFNIIVQSV